MYDRIEEMETGASSNPGKIAAAQREYANTVFEAIAKLKKNEFNEASLLRYHSYPAFENYLNAQGQKKVVPNLTLRQWNDQQSVILIKLLEGAYKRAKQLVAQGDYSHQDLEDFLNHTPFPYIHKIKQRWRTDRQTVEAQRIANAANWIVVLKKEIS